MRFFDSQMTSMVAVTALVAVVAAAFPAGALRFSAARPDAAARASSFASFVSLDAATEAKVLRLAKDAPRKADRSARVHADLVFEELPPLPLKPVLAVETRLLPPAAPLAAEDALPFLPSQAAGDPEVIAAPPETEEVPAFSRAELLNLR